MILEQWATAHPNEQVTFIELSDDANKQRAEMMKRGQAGSGEFGVMSVETVWTSEFAAKGWLQELPADMFPTTGMLASAVESATYSEKLYAYPQHSAGALLYYRKDLLDEAGLQAPKTWADMQDACAKVLPTQNGMSCYAGQHQKYEGLTSNITEAVNSAGGKFFTADGKPAVNTPEAIAGLQWMVDGFETGMIPPEALTWQEEGGRKAFQAGKLLFHRNWPEVWNLAGKTDGSSKIVGKFAVAPLPGKAGPGISTLGGHNLGISTFAANKGTAAEFIKWLDSPEIQKTLLEKLSTAPILESLYADPALKEQFPYLSTLGESIKLGKARPKTVKYGDVTVAIQDGTYAALTGQVDATTAFTGLQSKLEALLK